MNATQSFAPSAEMQMNRRISQASSRRFRRGFTLIELMVVVGIIIILVGLTVGVGVILHEKSEQRQVENTFKILDSAVAEWELEAERQMTWGKDDTPANAKYEIPSDKTGSMQLSALLGRLMTNPTCKEMLAKIDPSILVSDPANPGQYSLIDPWGTAIGMVHPGRKWILTDGGLADADGTIRTSSSFAICNGYFNEANFGVCINSRICFVSAGPNTKFGKLSVVPGSSDYVEQHDNIYSYQLATP